MIRRILSLCMILAVSLALSACGSSLKTDVLDYDTYQIVTIGPVTYTTPNNVMMLRSGGNFVEHRLGDLGDTMMRVYVDRNPPRDLKFDADAWRRQFLHNMNKSQSTSAQYDTLNGIRRVKITANGHDQSGDPIYGTMTLMRRGEITTILTIVGPWDLRGDIDSFMERMIPKIHLPALTAEEKLEAFEEQREAMEDQPLPPGSTVGVGTIGTGREMDGAGAPMDKNGM